MSIGSDLLLRRSLEVEHPVAVILLSDEGVEEEEEARDAALQRDEDRDQQNDDDEERTVKVHRIRLDQDLETGWMQLPRCSTDWSPEDADPFLTKVNVIVDTDEERKQNDNNGNDDDDDDDDDDYKNNDYDDTSTTVSELFRSTGSQIFRDAYAAGDVFLSADDSTSIQGHVTRRKFEVVEHETTRKCIVLAPNTELDSDDEQNEELLGTAMPDQTAYDVAAALYHSSIRDQDLLLPVVVFKMDSETQTSRNRTTQTGMDQSTMTEEDLREAARRKRSRRRQRNPVNAAGQGQEDDEYSEIQRSARFEHDHDQESTEAPEVAVQSVPRGSFRGAANDREPSIDRPMDTVGATMTSRVSVGQQTASHAATQTPVLVKLDANGSLWMPQEALLLAGFENISTGFERLRHPLGSYGNQASPRCRGNERSPTREFSTQTFGQMSRGGIPAETQTSSSPSDGYLDNGCLVNEDESRKRAEIEIVCRDDAEWTSKSERSRRSSKHDKKRKNNGHDRTKRSEKGAGRSNDKADSEETCDVLKTDLLKLMLHQIKTLKRQVDEVDEDRGKEVEEELEKDGGQHRSPRRHYVDTDERRCSSRKTRDSVDRVRKWKKQLDAPRMDDLEGRGKRRRSAEREWLSADDTNPSRSRLMRTNDEKNYRSPGNVGKGRSLRHSGDVERIRRSLTPSPSKGHDLFRQSNNYLPYATPYSSGRTPMKHHDPYRGHHDHHHHCDTSHDYPYNSSRATHPFRPLGTSSPALPLHPSRGSRFGLDIRREPRLSGSPTALGGRTAGSGGRGKILEREGDEAWKQRWTENVDPNSKRHDMLHPTFAGSSRRHHRF